VNNHVTSAANERTIQRRSHPSQASIELKGVACALVPSSSKPSITRCALNHRPEIILSGDSSNTRLNSRCRTGQLKNTLATAMVMHIGRIPRWTEPKSVAQIPLSDALAVGSKGNVRTTSSATSNRTSPPQRNSLRVLLEGAARAHPASIVELNFARTPPSVKSICS